MSIYIIRKNKERCNQTILWKGTDESKISRLTLNNMSDIIDQKLHNY